MSSYSTNNLYGDGGGGGGGYGAYGTPAGGSGGGFLASMSENMKKFADKDVAIGLFQWIISLYMASGMMSMAGMGRKRRQATTVVNFDENDQTAAIKLMTKLDEDDCIGLLVCHIASQPEENKTKEETIILQTMKLNPSEPVPWSEVCSDPMGKYQLAAEIGHLSQSDGGTGRHCSAKFKKCEYNATELMTTIREAAEKGFDDKPIRELIKNSKT